MNPNTLRRFGEYCLDPSRRLLTRAGNPVQVAPKTLDLLILLVDSGGRLLTKDELLNKLWPDTTVEEASLAFQVSAVRKVLGPGGAGWLVTVAKHGYRFTADVGLDAAVLINDAGRFKENGPKPRWLLWIGSAGTAALISVALIIGGARQQAARPELIRLTADGGLNRDPAVSPDGRLLAYASDRAGVGLDIWVRALAGGEPIRVTDHDSDDREPSFSPDGTHIAFRSERDGGGIYIAPSLGGQARLLVRYGRGPRFSPDGAWMAFWLGGGSLDGHAGGRGTGRMYIVRSIGGPPREVQPDFADARYPVWSSDGKWLLFAGSREPAAMRPGRYAGSPSWYISPSIGGNARDTGALRAIEAEGLSAAPDGTQIIPADWRGDRLVFAATSGDSTNVWEVSISPTSQKVSGRPRRVSFGTTYEAHPVFVPPSEGTRARTVVFASMFLNIDIFALPTSRGTPQESPAKLRRLTDAASAESVYSLSPDERNLVFATNRSGPREVWLKDLTTGSEKPFILTPGAARVRFNRAGSELAYGLPTEDRPIFLMPLSGGMPRKLCANCSRFWDVSDDRVWVLQVTDTTPTKLALLHTPSGQRSTFTSHSEYHLYEPSFSPDNRWVAFLARVKADRLRIYVAPFRTTSPVDRTEWIPITDGTEWDDRLVWAPNGTRLYFVSERDGFRCVWAQDVDVSSKRASGLPSAFYHSHEARLSIANAGSRTGHLSVGDRSIVLGQGELTGNIWMAKLP
jgi:eukaryotic-like serine/threonine-protein kinase